MMTIRGRVADAASENLRPLETADPCLAAYASGDKAAILAQCDPYAVAEYVPGAEAGRTSATRACNVWVRRPAALDGCPMPQGGRFEDVGRRTAIAATVHRDRQHAKSGGIASAGGAKRAACLLIIAPDEESRTARSQVRCDQVRLYRQPGFPAGFVAERAS